MCGYDILCWQMIEKAVEHNTKLFMLFIDLRKAYDSIPHQACGVIWRVMLYLNQC